MLNFDFLEKGLGIVYPHHFVYDFLRKIFLMLYSINWPNFIVWLPLLLETFDNMCFAIICFPSSDVISYETNLIFLIKPFFIWPKCHDKILNILGTKRTFKVKKVFFIAFKWLLVVKNCLRLESAPLKIMLTSQIYHSFWHFFIILFMFWLLWIFLANFDLKIMLSCEINLAKRY